MQRLCALAMIMDGEHGRGIQHILVELNGWCRQRPVRLCVCFGSQATGRARADNDVDVAVRAGTCHGARGCAFGVLYDSIEPALDDFGEFVTQIEAIAGG